MSAELVIKVAIADDHKIFRDGIKMALKDKDYLKIIWEAEDGRDLVHKMLLKKPDVLLMDIRMPEVDGINVIGILRKEYKEVKFIVFTMYVDKQIIRQVQQYYPDPIKFSEKEVKILRLLAQDKTTEEISKEVFLSPRTIETIRQNMKTKVGAKTIAGLIMYGMRNKLID